ncbi:MAG: pantetheine-phosphate adenylyltransferase [Candidatus Omnitrophica bacterium CG11_big_fil_rev_8_21_14_0_20_42_13]|uniref:Phosphopantetheine adenylyltransferase n=1 Tax=Candidatus Ghiorseimicrobium undicola TaxID=1974746 RepID=A0A2H0LY03_9BACT|nr:MAG: pantetheine-phosphate adenylyltransferase [Candidatus Omnitrophica bacterium CG11_big_fil_rev_8_21_14_0_20_42_13]
MCQKAIYPGTFDPVTYGHVDVIERALAIFPDLIVAIADSPQKGPLFSAAERLEMLKEATKQFTGLEIKIFDGLAVDFARKNKAKVIVRGLRMVSDFEYEFQMALTNRKIAADLETIFLMPSENYSYISSKLLKEAAGLGADLSSFLPPYIENKLKRRLKK